MSEKAVQSHVAGFGALLTNNKNELQRIDDFKRLPISVTPRNALFGTTVVGTGIVFVMFAGQILTGVAALAATGVVCVGGYFSWKFLGQMDPVFAQKAKNLKVRLMFEEARTNAVNQLESQVITNADRLVRARDSRNKIGAMVDSLKGHINPAKAGTDNHTRKTQMVERVEEAYLMVVDNLVKAAEANNDFKEKVIEYKDMDKFTSAANAVLIALGDQDDDLAEMLSLESFNEIEDNFHTALVSIENKAADMKLDEVD